MNNRQEIEKTNKKKKKNKKKNSTYEANNKNILFNTNWSEVKIFTSWPLTQSACVRGF